MNKLLGVFIVLVSGFSLIGSAWAKDSKPDDQVVLRLTGEDWVATSSAVVHVTAEAIQQNETADELKKMITSALNSLSSEGEWRFTRFSQSRDKTGLNRWRASAQARLPETALSVLRDRAKEASKPGFKLSIGHVDFSPSLSEFERTRSNLRQELYARIKTELDLLNAAFGARDYRLKEAYFDQPYVQPQKQRAPGSRMMTMSESAIAPSMSADIGVARKITMTVTVIFGAVGPLRDEK